VKSSRNKFKKRREYVKVLILVVIGISLLLVSSVGMVVGAFVGAIAAPMWVFESFSGDSSQNRSVRDPFFDKI
jgi:uncharacterized membrane protein YdbT with pleckstrin-like domain